jgi:hypothetical protein
MRQILLILTIGFFFNNLIAQDSIKSDYQIKGNAKILIGLLAILPSNETIISINNSNKITKTDSLGYFQFDRLKNGQYLIHIEGNGFKSLDTLVTINDRTIDNLQLLLISNCRINRRIADLDIMKGTPKLLVLGGFTPIIEINQNKFERKYDVEYFIYGDCDPPSDSCATDYNKRIFEFLDLKFGQKWRKQVRKDIAGL